MILELECMAHQQLLERGILYLGWQRCKIFVQRKCTKKLKLLGIFSY